MGFETERQKDDRLYFSIAQKNGEKKGIFYKDKDKNKIFVQSISGEVVSITKELCKAKEGGTYFEPFWQYKIELQDMQSNPTNFVLRLRRDNRTTDSIINSLASLKITDTKLKFISWINNKEQLSIFVSNGVVENNKDVPVGWKYKWDKERGDFETIPLIIEKPLGTFDALGKEKTIQIRDERDMFLEKELQAVAQMLTGKSWVNEIQNGKPQQQEQPASNPNESEADKLLNGIKANFKTANELLDKWASLAKRLRENVPVLDQLAVKQKIQAYLDSIKGESDETYLLNMDGTFTAADDLPF
jgi:hypothetical protein